MVTALLVFLCVWIGASVLTTIVACLFFAWVASRD